MFVNTIESSLIKIYFPKLTSSSFFTVKLSLSQLFVEIVLINTSRWSLSLSRLEEQPNVSYLPCCVSCDSDDLLVFFPSCVLVSTSCLYQQPDGFKWLSCVVKKKIQSKTGFIYFFLLSVWLYIACPFYCIAHRLDQVSASHFPFSRVGEDSGESLGLQGDPTSPFWRRSTLGFLWREWCWS